MNRRSFVSRLGAALAVAPVVASVKPTPRNELVPVPPGTVSQLCPGEDARDCGKPCPDCSPTNLTGIHDHAPGAKRNPKLFYEDRFTLLRSRGLIDPCPNCQVDAWKATERVVTCERCGWLDSRGRFERRCPCRDCGYRSFAPNVANSVWPPAMRAHLLDDAAIGFYAVVDHLQREVRRIERNVYNLNTDGWLHNVQQRQLARVLCGVYALHNPKDRSGIEQVQRPNGDLVFFHWENVDCYEWQRAREQGV